MVPSELGGSPRAEPEHTCQSPAAAGEDGHPTLGVRLAIAILAILSVSQALFFVLRRGAVASLMIALTLALATVGVRWQLRTRATRSVVVMSVLAILIALNLAADVVRAEPPFPFRILEVAVILGYAAVGLAGLAGLTGRGRFLSALLALAPVATVLLIGEIVLKRIDFVRTGGLRWEGRLRRDSIIGERYAPDSELRTYYVDNPRRYFDVPHPMQLRWTLETHEDAGARLEFQPNATRSMHVRIARPTRLLWHIQVHQGPIGLRAGMRYTVRFRARADARRIIAVSATQAHEPWRNLGYYREIVLDTAWQAFSDTLTPTADDDSARFGFVVGASDAGVDLADIELRRYPGTDLVEAVSPAGFSVTYRINNLGCRGHDYPVPRDSAVWRILALGDSRTFGVGVHEADVFTARLERMLNDGIGGSPRSVEVINCGVSGYSSRQERLFYEQIGVRYAPDVVLLAPVPNDDLAWLEEVGKGLAILPNKYAELFFTWEVVRQMRVARRFSRDYSGVREEIRQLAAECRQHQTRLAILLFASDGDKFWEPLARAVDQAVSGTGVPVLNVAPLFTDVPARDLLVHPAYDAHPNEIAHRIAAEALRDFFRREGLDGASGMPRASAGR